MTWIGKSAKRVCRHGQKEDQIPLDAATSLEMLKRNDGLKDPHF
jgi:hypothetical protein